MFVGSFRRNSRRAATSCNILRPGATRWDVFGRLWTSANHARAACELIVCSMCGRLTDERSDNHDGGLVKRFVYSAAAASCHLRVSGRCSGENITCRSAHFSSISPFCSSRDKR